MLPRPKYVPTEEEIAAACAEIRRGWSPAEHCQRAAGMVNGKTSCPTGGRIPWRLPTVQFRPGFAVIVST